MKNIEARSSLDHVKRRLLEYEIPEHLSGFQFIAEAIIKKLSNAYMTASEIYSALANTHGKTVGAISRDMNYAVKKSDKLAKMLSMDAGEVFASRVISFIAIHIKSKFYPLPQRDR